MGVDQSWLSHYPYDLAIAISVQSLNNYLEPTVGGVSAPDRYWVTKDSGTTMFGSIGDVENALQGIDPFSFADGDNSNDNPQLLKLQQMGFFCVIHASIGLPNDAPPATGLVTLTGPSSTVFSSFAGFKLYFCEFRVGQILPAGQAGEYRWSYVRQQSGNTETPLFFALQAPVAVNPAASAEQFPEAVRARAGLSSSPMFEVTFDLANATITGYPAVPNVTEGGQLQNVLRSAVFPQCADDYITNQCNLIGFLAPSKLTSATNVTAIHPRAAPYLSDWDGNWSDPPPAPVPDPSAAEANAASLELICAVDDHDQTPTQPIRWNWRNAGESHGVVAISAANFVSYLRKYLDPYVSAACPTPKFQSEGNYVEILKGGTPTIQTFIGGYEVLNYNFIGQADDVILGVNVSVTTNYGMSVFLKPITEFPRFALAPTICILQQASVVLSFSQGSSVCSGPVVSYSQDDDISIAVGQNGQLLGTSALGPLSLTTSGLNLQEHNSRWWADFDDLVGGLRINAAVKLSPANIDINITNDFFFPFGKSFSYADPKFSNNLDLYAQITIVE
jgi:hypothetical protein